MEPELSGKESRTVEILSDFLLRQEPQRLLSGVGGNGIMAVYQGIQPGNQILLRCDMDAVPVHEEAMGEHCSMHPGISHKCGHDGHMSILAGVARELRKNPPREGTVLLLFQPEEETGNGARRVLEDAVFNEFAPCSAFALHNLPGFPRGSVITVPGTFAEASKGLVIRFRGRSSHAGEPLLGISPAPAVAALIKGFEELCIHRRGILVTLVHARIGEVAFGTSPENAVVMATLRAPSAELMEDLSNRVVQLVEDEASSNGLKVETSWTEEFPPTVNSSEADSIIRDSARSLGLEVIDPGRPFPWSEDFGHFTKRFGGALFGLGAGRDSPPLHDPLYDFPDGIIETGVAMFMGIIERTPGLEI